MPKAKRKDLEIVPSEQEGADDRRMFCRFFVAGVPVRFKDLKMGTRGEGVCKDIGGGGAGIECPDELKVKTPLEMWFTFPDSFEPMHLLGRVVWQKQEEGSCYAGIAFDRQRLMSMARILKLTT